MQVLCVCVGDCVCAAHMIESAYHRMIAPWISLISFSVLEVHGCHTHITVDAVMMPCVCVWYILEVLCQAGTV